MLQPIVVFDLDGTLVDTAPDLIDTLNVILARHDVPPVAYDTARGMIGAGVKPLLQRALAAQGRHPPADEIDRLYREYLPLYAGRIAQLSRPFPGLERALDELGGSHRFAVCTNKLEWLSVRLLDQLGLTKRFAAICGQDTFGVQKPDPKILLGTIARAGGDRSRAVLVGDSMIDVATARAAGTPVVAVAFGYTETPAAEFGADRLIARFEDLPAAVVELVPPRP
jgi:phosphoglycolate phosphatase